MCRRQVTSNKPEFLNIPMAWFEKSKGDGAQPGQRRVRTEGLWIKCDSCRATIWKKDLEANQMVCPKCGFHFRIDALTRLKFLLDDENWDTFDANLRTTDVLGFVDNKTYQERLEKAEATTGLKDAIISAVGKLNGRTVAVCVMEYRFIGGSMGAVVGEKITRSIERAHERKMPMIIVSASGGARMMEGAVSLMQMAKISSALVKLVRARIPYLSILTDPTTGGVTASYAMLGDLNLAEPGALIGFAGPRVIEQTIRQKLPKGFQRAEFLVEHGMVDALVPRPEMKTFIAHALDFFCGPAQ